MKKLFLPIALSAVLFTPVQSQQLNINQTPIRFCADLGVESNKVVHSHLS